MVDPNMMILRRSHPKTKPMDFTFIAKIDAAAENLVAQGLLTQAIKAYKQGLDIRISLYGADSEEIVKFSRAVIKKVLRSSGTLIDKGEMNLCVKSLKLLEKISAVYLENLFIPEKCEIHNTLACAYKKLNKLDQAKSELKLAIKCIKTHKDAAIDRASIYLNMCTVLSNLKKHKEAAEYGKMAVKAAQDDIITMKLGSCNKARKVKLLAVAYHNLGVEEEFLKNYESALDWYRKAVHFLERNGSKDHMRLLTEFQKTYESAIKTIKSGKIKDKLSRKSEDRTPRLKKREGSEPVLFNIGKLKSSSRRSSLVRTQTSTNVRMSRELKHTFTQHIIRDSNTNTASLEKSDSLGELSDLSSASFKELEELNRCLESKTRPSTGRGLRKMRGSRRIITAHRTMNSEERELDEEPRKISGDRRPSTESNGVYCLMTSSSDITSCEAKTPDRLTRGVSFASKLRDCLKVSSPKYEISITPKTTSHDTLEITDRNLKVNIPPVTERSSNEEKSQSHEGNIEADLQTPEETCTNILFKNLIHNSQALEKIHPVILPRIETPRIHSVDSEDTKPPQLSYQSTQDSVITTKPAPVRSLSKRTLIPRRVSIDASNTLSQPLTAKPVTAQSITSLLSSPIPSSPISVSIEKLIRHYKFSFEITEEVSTSEHQVDPRAAYIGGRNIKIQAFCAEEIQLPAPAFISESEVCEILDIHDAKEIANRKESLQKYIDIYQNKIVLSRKNKILSQIKQLLYVTFRNLPVHGGSKLYFYTYSKDAEPIFENIIIEVECLSDPSNKFKPFSISDTELANILGVPVDKIQECYEDLADLVIIEGVFNVGISKRKPIVDEQPITICITSPKEECTAAMLGSKEIVIKEANVPEGDIKLQSKLKLVINFATKYNKPKKGLNPPQELEQAAMKIQRIYRNYRAKRPTN
jgi:tetratricopeptide (TPR) repeat protein